MSNFRYTRPDAFPPIIKNLIIINVLVFIAQITMDNQYHITSLFSLYPVMPPALKDIVNNSSDVQGYVGFKPYQIATHMFTHSPTMIFHIVFNMFTLWMFGRILENVWGGQRFLIFYIICGIGAAACHLGVQYFRCEELLHALQANDPNASRFSGALSPALGASGAIMGVLAAFAYLFPNTQLYLMLIPIPIKAKWAVLVWVGIDLFGGVANVTGDNIAHFAHLGGAITGFILVLIWNRTNRKKFY
ncbi:MAG: rhomboid family intramembrane serine protease [Flavisolibacter sp.]